MSERTIAEIIGWEWRGNRIIDRATNEARWSVPGEGGEWWPPGVSYSDGSPPNVDDILAWLLAQPQFVFENTFFGPMTVWGSKLGFVVTMTDADGDDLPSDCHPTLLAALEQIVRILDTHRRENPDDSDIDQAH